MAQSAMEKFKLVLYDNVDELRGRFTEKEIKQLLRIRSAHTKLLEDPLMIKRTLVDLIIAQFDISVAQAYYDIEQAEAILGDIKTASRQYMLHLVTEGAKNAFSIAQTNKDAKGMAAAMNIIGKYHKLDQPESQDFPHDKIIPPCFVVTPDIRVIRPDYNKNAAEQRLRVLKKTAPDLIVDAEVID